MYLILTVSTHLVAMAGLLHAMARTAVGTAAADAAVAEGLF